LFARLTRKIEGQMKKSILFAAATLVLLGGCVSHNFSEGKRTNYSCDGDREFSSREVAGSVEVYVGGQTQRLLPSGDGSYSNGTVTLTGAGSSSALLSRGGNATLTGASSGPYENCRARASQSWFPTIW
jgi:hypothetical protein